MHYPFIFCSTTQPIEQVTQFDVSKGLLYRQVHGEHAIWAARLPFLPAMMSDDFKGIGRNRIGLIVKRQFRFIYDLARARDNRATFELRFISTPTAYIDQPNQVDIVFLGKVFSTKARGGQELAEQLWDRFESVFPIEDPFNYPLQPIVEEQQFLRYYAPIPFEELSAESVLEIRKFEDVPVDGIPGYVERKGDYIVHPFVPNVDFSPMSRFLTTLANQKQKCWVSISIRPVKMFDQEIVNLSTAIGRFREIISQSNAAIDEYLRNRSEVGVRVYQSLLQEREQLLSVRVQIVGEYHAPRGLAEALGSEMMGNADNKYPTQWSVAKPADENELEIARKNLQYIEQDDWGFTIAPPPLQRLRYLATAQEVYGAFRLPVPPESGYMPGIPVKDEPFTSPVDATPSMNHRQEKRVSLGTIYHRGKPTSRDFQINIRDLTRHALIAGSTGSGKTNTIKYLLSQLWLKHEIPFLVLYPIDKSDYRDLLLEEGLEEHLLIFTLGDEGTSPFRFNPFEVPEGVLLKTHLSHLMRVFSAAFSLIDPLPMIYREALRQVYKQHGWNTVMDRGTPDRDYPLMSDFYTAIREITDNLGYGQEVKDTVRQASVIRIADLLENAGHVINVPQSMSFATVLSKPVIMELGRVGSSEDTNLLMGFLMVRLAEEFARNPRSPDLPHITVIEEAHRLMSDTPQSVIRNDTNSNTSEDFSNILSEVRGYGEGIIIAEQIPTALVKGAIGNTFTKVMHWIEDISSFTMFSEILNLSDQQKDHVRTFTAGFAVVRGSTGQPIQVKVPFAPEMSAPDDHAIRSDMERKKLRFGILDVQPVKWQLDLSTGRSSSKLEIDKRRIADLLLHAPMPTCAFCNCWLEEGKCLHRKTIQAVISNKDFDWRGFFSRLTFACSLDNPYERWEIIRELIRAMHLSEPGQIYCFLAHQAFVKQQTANYEVMKTYKRMLREFNDWY